MSEDKPPERNKVERNYTGEDVLEFTKIRRGSLVCPKCHNADLQIGPKDFLDAFIPVGATSFTSIMQTKANAPAALLYCFNCGNLEFVLGLTIQAWMDAGRPAR